jgi:hypothetical protein
MKKTFATATVAAATLAGGIALAAAEDSPSVKQAYREMEAIFGVVPTHMKDYPKSAIAWA